MDQNKKKPPVSGGSKAKQKNVTKETELRISDLEEKIKTLALTIDEVEDEKQNVENQLKNVLADYQNLESSIDKRIGLKSVQLKKQLGSSLLMLMDDIKFGLAASDDLDLSDEVNAWITGVSDTLRKMEGVLGELDITLMDVNPGDQFNSSVHEAIATIPAEKENSIVEVVQPGYMLDDLVVRPARVVVGKKK